jgi:predicted CXXCH cytochrome family protein
VDPNGRFARFVARLIRHGIATLVGAVFTVAVLSGASGAFAYNEPASAPEFMGANCDYCHAPLSGPREPTGCNFYACHDMGSPGMEIDASAGKGPHGLYSKTSDRCGVCHALHAAGGEKLLPRSTVTASCFMCHDGTGGKGVYGAVYAQAGIQPGSAHRIDTTTIVPGGDASSGASSTMSFGGPDGTLGCVDCHSPHDSNTVEPYLIERWRNEFSGVMANSLTPGLTWRGATSTHLLRQRPAGSATAVAAYGSDWCLACHAGRASGGEPHNHPVGSTFTEASPSTYSTLPVLASDAETSLTVLGVLAGANRGYLMPYPRTALQAGHSPICQQCHEDSRYVGVLVGVGDIGDAATYTITAPDGIVTTDNPRFQNFPHETVNPRMVVETGDGLCKNCHPPGQLR